MVAKKREIWLDYLKCIAVFLVVWGHILLNCVTNDLKYNVAGIIYAIHIPLFLVISGYLITDKPISATLKIIFKRFIIPYIVWCIIMSLFYLGKKRLTNIDLLVENIIAIKDGILYDFLWFIKAYSLSYFLYQILKFKTLYRAIIGIVVLVVLNLMFLNIKPFSQLFSLTLYTYTFISLSSLIKDYIKSITVYQGLGCLLLFVLLSPFITWENNYFNMSFAVLYENSKWYIFIVRLLIGISASLFLISLKCLFDEQRLSISIIPKIGEHTISIYLLQTLLVEGVLPRIIQTDSILLSFILALFMLLLSYMVVIALEKNRILNSVLFGNYK
ncbi:MAG: acyltransferase family protein [Bacteroidaceae bacterium]|nr:acyltransferase family protein [Bacteroidaceae bacterium]